MKFKNLLVTICMFAFAISGCSSADPTPTLVSPSPTVTLSPGRASHGNPIGGHVEFVDALRAAGATVEPTEPITQAFFTPEGIFSR